MAVGLISESDTQKAIDRLRGVLSDAFLRGYFGRERMLRLERIVGTTLAPSFLLDLLVRSLGPSLLAERLRRIGSQETSVRRLLLESLPEGELGALFAKLRGDDRKLQRKSMERELAEMKWHRGSPTTLRLARAVGLPDAFAGAKESERRDSSYEIAPQGVLKPLKSYQRGILREIRAMLEGGPRVMVSSFTGTGKTRMGMEFVVDQLLAEEEHPLVLWVAQKGELLEQACDSIEQLWPWRGVDRVDPLLVVRFWEGNRFDEELPLRPTLVIASSQQLVARLNAEDPLALQVLARARLLVIDEAHHAFAKGHQLLLDAYERARKPLACRTLGLTATPGRSNLMDPEESRKLADLFGRSLIVPRVAERGGALGWFQASGYLSTLRHRSLEAPSQVAQTLGKRKMVDEGDQTGYRDFTQAFLEVVGEDSTRNRFILEELARLDHEGRQMLVFCCNIAQAELLAQALIVSGVPASVIHHNIDARDRHHTIAQFRRGELRILFNVEVLTTGFDAPKVDTIVMCRPTLSRVLYEQMVGRGMRGPEMGGTETCEIVDFTGNFGKFHEPQAWEHFWDEWNRPESENLERVFEQMGWNVVGAEPDLEAAPN
ncbi:MAG: helicase-related protein [Thermoanaerobaculia bacterium]